MTRNQERRQYPRAEVKWSVTIQRDNRFLDGLTKNLSYRGACICCNHKLHVGEQVHVTITSSDRLSLVLDAAAVWSNILSQNETCGIYGLGVRFIEISEKDRQTLLELSRMIAKATLRLLHS